MNLIPVLRLNFAYAILSHGPTSPKELATGLKQSQLMIERMACLFLVGAVALSGFAQHGLRMNQIQIVGSHNSYHAGMSAAEMALLRRNNPGGAAALAYRHPKIEVQLDAGVRQLELDLYGDA